MLDDYIKNAFSQYGNTPAIPTYVYWVIFAIFILGLGLYLLKNYSQKKLEQMEAFAKFQTYAQECGIENQLWEVLLTIIQTQNITSPINILKNTETYDTASSAYLKMLLAKGIKAGEYEELLIQVTKIRERIAAKSKEQFKPIESTADLFSGLELQVELKTGPHAGQYESSVASVNANNLVIHAPTVNQRKLFFNPDDVVSVVFSREADAVYQFETIVLGRYQGSLSAILLKNTKNINIQYIRRYTRINPNFLIKVIGTSAPIGPINTIENLKTEPVSILDISGGGLQLQINPTGLIKNYLDAGKILVFSIYIPEIGTLEEIRGKIIRVDNISDKNYLICSLEFVNMTSKIRCRLLQGILKFISKVK